ncbi:MAG: polyprenol monophosphomannose synthase [Acidimicrobiia bacterium]
MSSAMASVEASRSVQSPSESDGDLVGAVVDVPAPLERVDPTTDPRHRAWDRPLVSPAVPALVVLPTYNEVENIAEVLTKVRAAVPDARILVVDDGSPDGTADLAEHLGVELGNIEVLRRSGKQGLGSAYRAGFRWGLDHGLEILVEMDSDLSHDPAALPSLLAAVEGGADLAIGSRYVPGGSIPDWAWHRRKLSRWGNRYAGAVLGMKVRDATAGYRAYRAGCLRNIDLDTVKADGYGFQIEMAYRVSRAGGVIVEVPIAFVDRVRGTSKMSGRIVVEALRLVTLWGVRDRLLHRSRR